MTTALLSELSRSGQEGYQSAINSAVRGLWRGVLDRGDFKSSMTATIDRWLTIAWREGMTDAGVDPNEISATEQLALARMIAGEDEFVGGFADAIKDASKANGGALQPLLDRAAKWASKYARAKEMAYMMASADTHLKWKLGQAENHCNDCPRLAGKVKRASEWLRLGIFPGSPKLQCGKYCKCPKLEKTNEPISKGPLPRLTSKK